MSILKRYFNGHTPTKLGRVSGNLAGIGDRFPTNSLVLMEHEYNLYCKLVKVLNLVCGGPECVTSDI